LVLDIEFFKTENGSSPVEKYLKSLENERMHHVLYQIQRLAKNGVRNMPPKMIKSVKGIYYLRISDKKGIHRVFFTVEKGKILLLLHAFEKKEQKLKNTDIDQAEARLKEWRKRYE
jgi:phage-related protein